MFGWFKRKKKNPVTLAAFWGFEPPKYEVVGAIIGHPTKVIASDEDKAWELVHQIFRARINKKKHSHLLAELKALEVK